MTDFGCANGGRFPGAASFLRETRKGRVRRGEEIRAGWLGRRILPEEPASLSILLSFPSALAGRAQGDDGGLLAGPLASKMRGDETKVDCRRGGRSGSSVSAYHVGSNVFPTRPKRKALSYELLPIKGEDKGKEGVVGGLDVTS
jgi:hypothetical protein